MFLLNENLEYHAEGILKVFTIQNVPIKQIKMNKKLFEKIDLQYKMFLLNKNILDYMNYKK